MHISKCLPVLGVLCKRGHASTLATQWGRKADEEAGSHRHNASVTLQILQQLQQAKRRTGLTD